MSRTYTREQVAQVVEDDEGLGLAMWVAAGNSIEAWPKSHEGWKATYRQNALAVAREVLRRLDALPNPPAAPERSTPCRLYKGASEAECLECGPVGTWAPRPRAMPNVETPLTPEQRDAMNAMIQASPLGQRPRRPTPVPEVPALGAHFTGIFRRPILPEPEFDTAPGVRAELESEAQRRGGTLAGLVNAAWQDGFIDVPAPHAIGDVVQVDGMQVEVTSITVERNEGKWEWAFGWRKPPESQHAGRES